MWVCGQLQLQKHLSQLRADCSHACRCGPTTKCSALLAFPLIASFVRQLCPSLDVGAHTCKCHTVCAKLPTLALGDWSMLADLSHHCAADFIRTILVGLLTLQCTFHDVWWCWASPACPVQLCQLPIACLSVALLLPSGLGSPPECFV